MSTGLLLSRAAAHSDTYPQRLSDDFPNDYPEDKRNYMGDSKKIITPERQPSAPGAASDSNASKNMRTPSEPTPAEAKVTADKPSAVSAATDTAAAPAGSATGSAAAADWKPISAGKSYTGAAAPAADEKYPTVNYALKMLLFGVFMVLICAPLLTMLLLGTSEKPLESEKEATLSAPSIEGWLDGSFQKSFESWFSTHYPSRGQVVTFYRQLKFDADSLDIINLRFLMKEGEEIVEPQTDAEDDAAQKMWEFMFDTENNMYAQINIRRRNDTPVEPTGFKGSDAVLIGKSGYLFESAYIDEYYGYAEPYISVTDEGLVTLVDMLEYIQDQLAKRGITMVYLLSSSKASQYAEYIPEWYKNTKYPAAGYVRPYTRLKKLLSESTINYVDASDVYKEAGLYATFPKTGIHWNHLASFEATRAVIDRFCEISGKNAFRLATRGVIETKEPPNIGGSSDVDVYNILYGTIDKTGSIVDDYYYAPDGYIANPDDGEKINVLVQGGSFTHDVINYLNKYRIVSKLRSFYYNKYSGLSQQSPFGILGYDAWETLLDDIDLVIFEQTEQQIRSEFPTRDDYIDNTGNYFMGSNVVYASLYYYLKDNEIR